MRLPETFKPSDKDGPKINYFEITTLKQWQKFIIENGLTNDGTQGWFGDQEGNLHYFANSGDPASGFDDKKVYIPLCITRYHISHTQEEIIKRHDFMKQRFPEMFNNANI